MRKRPSGANSTLTSARRHRKNPQIAKNVPAKEFFIGHGERKNTGKNGKHFYGTYDILLIANEVSHNQVPTEPIEHGANLIPYRACCATSDQDVGKASVRDPAEKKFIDYIKSSAENRRRGGEFCAHQADEARQNQDAHGIKMKADDI